MYLLCTSFRDSLTCQLERELFQGSDHTATGVPVLCVQEYVDQCADLTTLINALEEDVKLLVKDYDKKKKVIEVLEFVLQSALACVYTCVCVCVCMYVCMGP